MQPCQIRTAAGSQAGRFVSPPWLFPQCLRAHGLPPEPCCRFVFLLAHFPLSWLTDVHQPQPRPLASVPLNLADLPADILRSIPATINGHSICSICTAEILILQLLLSPDGPILLRVMFKSFSIFPCRALDFPLRSTLCSEIFKNSSGFLQQTL